MNDYQHILDSYDRLLSDLDEMTQRILSRMDGISDTLSEEEN